jgi:WD40 repeat protein
MRFMYLKSLSAAFCCIVVAGMIMLLSVLVSCTKDQEKTKVTGHVAASTTLVATIAEGDSPPSVISGHETDPGLKGQPPAFKVLFSESGGGAAYVASRNGKFYVVHNQVRGKEYLSVGSVVLSPDGRRIAYPALVDRKWRMVVDGKEGKKYDTLLSPAFSPDGKHIVYQAKEGDTWYMVVDDVQNSGTMASFTTPEFSADSSKIVFIEAAESNTKMKLIVSDLTFGKQNVIWSIGDQLFTTSRDKSRVAAVQVVRNKFRVIDFNFSTPDVVHEGRLYDVIENLTLSNDGKAMSYCALNGRERLIFLNDRVEQLPEGRAPELPVIRPDKKGVGILMGLQTRVSLHQAFSAGNEKVKSYDEIVNLTYSKDGSYAYAARTGKNWFIVANGKDGPIFDRAVDPGFSPDGKFLAYRVRKDGKRFVVVADASGNVLRQHPSYEQVFDVKFTADGRSVAYGVQDGQKLTWKVVPL